MHFGGVYHFKSESNAIEFAKGELDRMDAGLQALRSLSGQLGRC